MALIKYEPHWYCAHCLDELDYDLVKAIISRAVAVSKISCEECGRYATSFLIHESVEVYKQRQRQQQQLEQQTRELPSPIRILQLAPPPENEILS